MTQPLLDVRGKQVPEPVQSMLTSPAALRARATVRVWIAAQDLEHWDREAYERNTAEAGRLLCEAAEKESF